jgi:hypothetical protein
MNIIVVTVIAVALFAALASSALYAAPRTDPGSFLVYKADSVDSFVSQIASNKRVAARYARHYSMSPDKLIAYFRENIKIKTLDKPYRTTVYFMSKGNIIKKKQRVLKAGSRVFVGPNGLPLLEWRCGNPLSKKLPVVVAKDTGAPTPDWAVAPAPVAEIAASAAEALPQAVPIAAAPTLALQNIAPAAGGFSLSPPLMILGGALPMLIGGVAVNNSQSTPAVPEPSSILTLAMGASGIIAYTRRRGKRR